MKLWKDLPSRLPGCVKYAKNKKTVSAESGNITFMLANKTFFFSRWTHNLFVPRKRAKWKMTSQRAFYDAMSAAPSVSFPAFFNEVSLVCTRIVEDWLLLSMVCSLVLKPFCSFRQNMFLHVKVLRLFGRKSRWKKSYRLFSLLSVQ